MHMRSDKDGGVVQALLTSTEFVEPAPGGWRATLGVAGPIDLRVRRVGGDWIEVSAAGPALDAAHHAADAWMLLRLNARLDGGVRIGLSADGRLLFVADLAPADDAHDEDMAASRLPALLDEMRLASLELSEPLPHLPPDDASDAATAQDPERLGRLCAEAGWPLATDASHRMTVRLPTAGGGSIPAALHLSRDATLEAVVALADAPPRSAACRTAVAIMLLRLSASTRAVKGVVIRSGDDELPAIASAWASPVSSSAAVDRAICAIAAACRMATAEAGALYDDEIARHYLSLNEPRLRLDPVSVPVNDLQEDTPCLRQL
jgi:hypothetical protein